MSLVTGTLVVRWFVVTGEEAGGSHRRRGGSYALFLLGVGMTEGGGKFACFDQIEIFTNSS